MGKRAAVIWQAMTIDCEEEVLARIEREERRLHLYQMLSALTPVERRLIENRYLSDLGPRHPAVQAEELGLDPKRVGYVRYRALHKLRLAYTFEKVAHREF